MAAGQELDILAAAIWEVEAMEVVAWAVAVSAGEEATLGAAQATEMGAAGIGLGSAGGVLAVE